MCALAKEFPDKPVYFTEGSTYAVNGAVRIMSFFENMARSYNAWVTVIDNHGKPNNGPHRCSPTCIVLNSETLGLEYRFDYYMYGHFSKFIQRGAVRLGSTPSTPRFANAAFRNPGGAIVLVVANNEPVQKQFTIRFKDTILSTALDRQSIATYRWQE
jgi:O-glycosyl hydrolase